MKKLLIGLVVISSVSLGAIKFMPKPEIQMSQKPIEIQLEHVAEQASKIETNIISAKENPQVYCLAQNIYFEARGSTLADQAAVADVVLNRVQARGFPGTVCGVVKQAHRDASGNVKRNKCQFSWYCDKSGDSPKEAKAWLSAQYVAYSMIHKNYLRGITNGATHYHASYVKPYWRKAFDPVAQIGAHIYYRPKV
jgi:spore germination cell wall hydrolase CwlJ-like protein